MKKYPSFLILILFSLSVQSQNVGIGTNTPSAKLDVNAPSSNYVAQFNGASPMYMGIFEGSIYRGYWGSYSGNPEDVDFGTGAGNATGKLHFTIQASPKLTIDAAGNVGVGTTSPVAKLEIANIGVGDALKITHRPGFLNTITSIDNNGTLYHEGGVWVHSGYGQIRFGYPSQGWAFGTVNGGQDLQLWSYNPNFSTQTIRMYMDGLNGNVGIGTGNTAATYRLEVEAGTQTGIHARSTVNRTDSAAIMAVLDVPTGADFRVAAVRGESKSTTSNSIGVYGLQNGGGFGVAGSVKEAGVSGWGAGVYGEAGLKGIPSGIGGYGVYGSNLNTGGTAGYFLNNAADANSRALKTNGKVQFIGIGESAGRVLTTDATGLATWQDATLVPHNHFGETWSGDITTAGLTITNSNTTNASAAGIRVNSGSGTLGSRAVEGNAFSTNGIGILGSNISSGSTAAALGNTGVAGLAGTGTGVFGASNSGASIYGRKATLGATGNAGKFENTISTNTDPVVLITNNATNPTALELNNGFLKVSGTNKTVFTITSAVSNINANQVKLSYTGMASTDILIVTHNFSGAYIGAIGAWWNGTQWTIYREDVAAMPVGEIFNVLVVKQ